MDREPEQIADEWLVLSAQGGSSEAMAALVRRWQPKLLAHARRVTGRADAAGDVVQEAWLAMLRSIAQLRDPAAFRGWAYRIVHARAVDWVRQRKRHREAVEKQAQERSHTDNTLPDDSTDEQQTLAAAIERLPPDENLLLRMYYVERMQVREIAAVLDMPSGTVKYRLFQLRKNLRNLIEGERHETQKH